MISDCLLLTWYEIKICLLSSFYTVAKHDGVQCDLFELLTSIYIKVKQRILTQSGNNRGSKSQWAGNELSP